MNKQHVIQHFGTLTKTARALGVSPQAIDQWPETIPIGRAYQVEVVSRGKLKVRDYPEAYRK